MIYILKGLFFQIKVLQSPPFPQVSSRIKKNNTKTNNKKTNQTQTTTSNHTTSNKSKQTASLHPIQFYVQWIFCSAMKKKGQLPQDKGWKFSILPETTSPFIWIQDHRATFWATWVSKILLNCFLEYQIESWVCLFFKILLHRKFTWRILAIHTPLTYMCIPQILSKTLSVSRESEHLAKHYPECLQNTTFHFPTLYTTYIVFPLTL